jgi:hypothetical protein
MDEERLAAIENAILELAEAIRQVCEKVAAIDEEVDKLGSTDVYGRLERIESDFGGMVGGFNDILDGRKKRKYTEEFGSKYPQFGKYADVGKRFGLDIMDIASNKAYEYDNGEGASDEGREELINGMISDLSAKFDDILALLEKQQAHEQAETPAEEQAEQGSMPEKGVEIEVSAGPASPDGEGMDKLREAAKKFKGRNPF